MRTRLLARIERLELVGATVRKVLLQYGWIQKLPEDYVGEREVAIVSRLSVREGLEWIEAKEVAGSARIATDMLT